MAPFPLRNGNKPTETLATKNNGAADANATKKSYTRSFLSTLPTVREYILDIWPDLLAIIVIGVLALALNTVDAVGATARKFIIWDEAGNFVNHDIGFPRSNKNIIPIWLCTFLAVIIPVLGFVLCQLRVKSAYDLHVAFWSLIWAIILASIFQVFNKMLIGGVRPHFLDACKPRPDLRPGDGVGFNGLYFTSEICTGENKRWINDALKSWPSGHTAVSFGGFVLLSLYLNGKLKIFSDERPLFYKLVLFFTPLLFACLIGGAMILDHSHQWFDVFGGAVIGIFTAFASYRANYAAIWDFRFNHIPLTRPRSPWKRHHLARSHHQESRMEDEYNGHFSYTTHPSDRFPDVAHGREMQWPYDNEERSRFGYRKDESDSIERATAENRTIGHDTAV